MDKQSAPQREYVSPPGIVAGQRPMSAPRTNAAIADSLLSLSSMPHDLLNGWRLTLREAAAALRKEPPAPEKRPAWNEAWDLTPEEARELDAFRAKPSRVQGQTFKRVPLQPPALPAEVERAIGDLEAWADNVPPSQFAAGFLRHVATLLRRYAQAVAERDADREHFRARVFLASSGGSSHHSTGCTIWGDDGQGHTEEGFTQPLPCNCGALINFHKKGVATLQREAREKDAEIARLAAIEARAETRLAELAETEGYVTAHAYEAEVLRKILREEH